MCALDSKKPMKDSRTRADGQSSIGGPAAAVDAREEERWMERSGRSGPWAAARDKERDGWANPRGVCDRGKPRSSPSELEGFFSLVFLRRFFIVRFSSVRGASLPSKVGFRSLVLVGF